ncbi:MAG: hypothetical protein PHS18_03325 [Sphaerochaetaceae bacterium]|nr:hypothetical protein [Sphaerochaetaceae bacterium]
MYTSNSTGAGFTTTSSTTGTSGASSTTAGTSGVTGTSGTAGTSGAAGASGTAAIGMVISGASALVRQPTSAKASSATSIIVIILPEKRFTGFLLMDILLNHYTSPL